MVNRLFHNQKTYYSVTIYIYSVNMIPLGGIVTNSHLILGLFTYNIIV